MLASIHPLGERARNNLWRRTVTAFAVGSTAAGAGVGAAAGAVGWAVRLGGLRAFPLALAASMIAVVPLEASGRVPGKPRRQVNEDWLNLYRGWVYGAGFGAQLGVGFATVITTFAVPAAFACALATGSPAPGAAVGAVFGLARALPLFGLARVDRPDRLRALHRRMAAAAPAARAAGAVGLAVAGCGLAAATFRGVAW